MCIFTCRNMSEALRVKRALSGAGIVGTVVSVDPAKTTKGCSVGVEVPVRQCYGAETLLRGRSIRYGELLR